MTTTRATRTRTFNNLVKREWAKYWWNWIMTDSIEQYDRDLYSPDLEAISHNPNIATKFIYMCNSLNYKCHWLCNSDNQLTRDKNKFEERKYREYLAAYRIQQWWIRIHDDPTYRVCREKVAKDYDEMFK